MKRLRILRLTFHGICAATLLLTGCAAQKETQLQPVRQRFVPLPRDSSSGSGATWTALHQFSDDRPGVFVVMAHAGIGDTFPVQEDHKPKVFEVTVVAGDDDHLVLDVRSEEVSQRLDLRRDGTVCLKVAEHYYSLAYPSVTIDPDSTPTTDKAMIMVHRLP